jgi:acyl-CoA reductase-like NAD-dependent aldehyde dehydrogenase
MMTKQKKKSSSKKDAGVKSKTKTKGEVTGKTKTAKTVTAKKAAKKKTSAANKKASKPTPEERYRMVQTAAYFIAEQHGFQGRSDEHWAAAERAIAIKLGQ